MGWGITAVLSVLVVILAAALARELFPQTKKRTKRRDPTPPRAVRRCGFCGRPNEASIRLKECTGCHVTRYCSEACQGHHWADHKPLCRAVQDARRTTYHDALVIPADGGPAVLRKVAFSVEAASVLPDAPFLRVVDLRELFGEHISEVRHHRIAVRDNADTVNGDYIMFYATSPALPRNEHLLRSFGELDLPQHAQFWHGDVVIAKFVKSPWPDEYQDKLASLPPVVDYVDLPAEARPVVQHWMQRFYEIGFEQEKVSSMPRRR